AVAGALRGGRPARGAISLGRAHMLRRERSDEAGVGPKVARLPGELPGEQTTGLGRKPELAGKAGFDLVAEGAFERDASQGSAQAGGRGNPSNLEREGALNDRRTQAFGGGERGDASARLV